MKESELDSYYKTKNYYKFGFLIYDSKFNFNYDLKIIPSIWKKYNIFEYCFIFHPEVEFKVYKYLNFSVVVIGDIFSIGKFSIKYLLNKVDFFSNNLSSFKFLDNLSGRFAIIAVSKGKLVAINDAIGSRSLFYNNKKNTPVFSSHSNLLALFLKIRKRSDVQKFIETDFYKSRRVKYLPGDLTIHDNIYALIPNHLFKLPDQIVIRYWPISPRSENSMSTFLNSFNEYLNAFTNFLKLKKKKYLIGITGGIDSRVLLSALNKKKIYYEGCTWSHNLNKKLELNIINEIIKTLSINHSHIDVIKTKSDYVSTISSVNGGGYRKGPLCEQMFLKYKKKEMIFINGLGAEIMRGFYTERTATARSIFSQNEMVRLYLNKPRFSIHQQEKCSYAENFVLSSFEKFYKRGEYNSIRKLGYDYNDIFYWEHRMGMLGSARNNELDPAIYSYSGFNSRKLYSHAFGLFYKERLTKNLLRNVIRYHSKFLYDLPYV
jgi:hypothetical protein